MTEYTTRELARSNAQQSVAVWFQTTEGKISVRMTTDGLIQLHGLVSDAVGRIPVDSSNALPTGQGVGVEPRSKGIG